MKLKDYRVLHGGSWSDGAELCRVACRNRINPAYRLHDVGFRLMF